MTVLAYLGPETMLPMTSVLAAAAGFVMMFGRKVLDVTRAIFRRQPTSPSTGAPAATASRTRARGHRPTGSRPVAASPVAATDEVEATDAA